MSSTAHCDPLQRRLTAAKIQGKAARILPLDPNGPFMLCLRLARRTSLPFVREAMFLAEPINLRANLVPNSSCLLQSFLVSASHFRRIVKGPVQNSRNTREDRATFGLRFAANGYNELKELA